MKISRLGHGTGSAGGKVPRDLGSEGFTRLLRHAYDRRLTCIATAANLAWITSAPLRASPHLAR